MPLSDIFGEIVARLGEQANADLADTESLRPPETPEEFAEELIYIICNAGMKNAVARKINKECKAALHRGDPVFSVFHHPTKARAIERIWNDRVDLHTAYLNKSSDSERLSFLELLPWIGPATKYHAAKSFGLQIAKPDRHLERLAKLEGANPQDLCERIAKKYGLGVAQVDTILWRACSLKILDSSTGEMTGIRLPEGHKVHKPNRKRQHP